MICKSCGNEFEGRFCTSCGAPANEVVDANDQISGNYPIIGQQPMMGQTQKPPIKKWFTKWWVWAIAAVVIIGAASSAGNDDKPTAADVAPTATIKATVNNTPTPEPTATPTVAPTEAPTPEPAETEVDDTVVEAALAIMQENFEGTGIVDLDKENKLFSIIPTDSAFILEINSMMNGDEDAVDTWETLVSNMQDLSNSLTDVVPGYSIALVNPANTENTLLLFIDGYEFYNFMDE